MYSKIYSEACNICLKSNAGLFNLYDRIKSHNLCVLLQTLVGSRHKINGENFWICLVCHSILQKIFSFQQKICNSQDHIATLLSNCKGLENVPRSIDSYNLPSTSNEHGKLTKNVKVETAVENDDLIHIIADGNTSSACDSTVLENVAKDFPSKCNRTREHNDHQESDDDVCDTSCAPENETASDIETSTDCAIETSKQSANDATSASVVANNTNVSTKIQEPIQTLPKKTVLSVIAKIENEYLNNLKCRVCQIKSENINILKSHMESKHKEEAIKWCEMCNKVNDNELFHTCQDAFICVYCKLSCSNPIHLVTHLYCHVDKRDDNLCQTGVFKSTTLPLVIKRKRYICRRCKTSYSDETLIRKHKCPQAPKPSSSGADNICGNLKKNVCKFCNKIINHSMKEHIRIHTGEKPYICEYCGKAFSQMGSKTTHLRIHTGRLQCHTCPKSFITRAHLRNHVNRAHKGEKPEQKFLCTTCGYSCIFEFQLRRHLLSHTDERKYGCSQCQMSFKEPTGLKRHMAVHTGIKPHACTLCHYRSDRKSNLRTHMKKHANEASRQAAKNGENVLQCEHCDRPFHTQDLLLAHIRSSHRKLFLRNATN